MHSALIIFIKNPQLGKVKTRIARTLGDTAALEIYRQLTTITRKTAESLPNEVVNYVFYDEFVATDDEWTQNIFHKNCQTKGDLGQRMATAFQLVLEKHQQACIIGSDCPTLSKEILMLAFEKLQENDAVIGPSTDGGYYLLGISKRNEDWTRADFLFENMAWSTDCVLSETLHRLQERGWSVYQLPALTDVDEAADWEAFLQITSK